MEHENLGIDANGEATSGLNHEGESTNAMLRGGLPGSSGEAEQCPWSEAGRLSTTKPQRANWQQEEPAVLSGGRQLSTDGTSRMNREVQVRICEGLGVKFPGPTRRA